MTKGIKTKVEDLPVENRILKKLQPPAQPWRRARSLEENRAAEFLTPDDIYNKIALLDNPRDRCMMAIIYLCGARIQEVVRYQEKTWGKKEVYLITEKKQGRNKVQDYKNPIYGRIFPSVRKGDFTIERFEDREVMVFNIRNLKNRQKRQKRKLIPCPLDNEMNRKFIKLITFYTDSLEDGEELFPIGKRRAEQILEKTGFNPHFLREVRLTHMVRYYNLSDQKLLAFAGWTDSRPAKNYIRVRWEDLVNSM